MTQNATSEATLNRPRQPETDLRYEVYYLITTYHISDFFFQMKKQPDDIFKISFSAIDSQIVKYQRACQLNNQQPY